LPTAAIACRSPLFAGIADDPAKVRTFAANARTHMPVAIDDGTLRAWVRVEATPSHLLIGRDGRVASAGHQDGPRLDAASQRVLSGDVKPARIATAPVSSVAVLKPGDRVPDMHLCGGDDATVRFVPGATGRRRAILFTAVWMPWRCPGGTR
jgi:hypothetical protein